LAECPPGLPRYYESPISDQSENGDKDGDGGGEGGDDGGEDGEEGREEVGCGIVGDLEATYLKL